jgi:type II secretory pathway pseudopilin PulG
MSVEQDNSRGSAAALPAKEDEMKGYTLIEILAAFSIIATVVIGGTILYIAIHFVLKF